MSRWEAPALSIALLALASGADAQGVHDALIAKHAAANNVPEALVRRVIRIESRGNPGLVVRGNYGLMQIRLGTARAMGYTGNPQGLLDPETNMTYAVKYLAGAYRTAGCNADRAITNYQHGYRRKARAKCVMPQTEPTQVASGPSEKAKPRAAVADRMVLAQSQTKPASEPDTVQSADVLKPKVVHTLAIPKLVSPPEHKPLAPVHVTSKAAPPAPRTQTASTPMPVLVPTKSNESAKSDKVVTSAPQTETASAPLPQPALAEPVASTAPDKPALPVRAEEPDKSATTGMLANVEPAAASEPPAPAPAVLPSPKQQRHAAPLPATKHATKRHHERKKADKPTNLLAFLKKLVTSNQKPAGRKHRSRQAQR